MEARVVWSTDGPEFAPRPDCGFRKMKSRRSAVLVSVLSAFFAGGVAFGQAPSQGLGSDGPLGDQAAPAGRPSAAQAEGASLQPHRKPSGVGVAQSSQGNPLWTIPLASLHSSRERPLFSASRRPPPPFVAQAPKVSIPTAPQPAKAPEKPQVTLVGTVHGPSVEMGVFVDETDKSLLRLRVGQSVRGWTVHSVEPRTATLEKAEQQIKVDLPARNTETAAARTSPEAEETASLPQTGPSAPLHGVPVGRIKPFATAGGRFASPTD